MEQFDKGYTISGLKRSNVAVGAGSSITDVKDCWVDGDNNFQLFGNNNSVTVHNHYNYDPAMANQLKAVTEMLKELLELTAPLLDQKQREHFQLKATE